MKNVLRNKKLVIAIIAVCFIGLGVAVCFLSGTKEESKKGNGDTSITEQTDNNQNENDSKENNKTDSSNENGLKVVEPQEGKIDSADGSGSWGNNVTDTEEKGDDSSSNDTSDDNILVDDKVWGDVK